MLCAINWMFILAARLDGFSFNDAKLIQSRADRSSGNCNDDHDYPYHFETISFKFVRLIFDVFLSL